MRLRTLVYAKNKVLEMAIAQDPQDVQNDLSSMNTWVQIDMRSIPWGDKNELLQIAVEPNISDLTKLEVKYNKLQKTHEAVKQQLDAKKVKLKVANNNIPILRASLVATPIADSLKKKDDIIAQKDPQIAQLQQSINLNKVDKTFLLNIKKFLEQNCQEIKDLIHIRDHVETCLMELKGLEAEVNILENILDPLLEQTNKAYEKLNKASNECL